MDASGPTTATRLTIAACRLSPRRPAATRSAIVHPPMKPNLKFQGVYPWPWWGVQTAATFQSLAGPQILAQQETTNAQILPSLGRNLAACGTAAVCNATVLLDLLPPATLYGDRIYQVDIRFSKTMRAGRTAIRPMVSIYNLLNANPVLSYNRSVRPVVAGPDRHPDRAVRGRRRAGGLLNRSARVERGRPVQEDGDRCRRRLFGRSRSSETAGRLRSPRNS